MNRSVPLLSFVALTVACRREPSGAEQDGSRVSAASSPQESVATVERCGPGFRGQMISPRGEILQHEAAQTRACKDDDCGGRTAALMFPRHFAGKSCDEVRANLKDKPIMDVWGAQARVICNGHAAQAISAGHDGRIGTCDDLGITIAVNALQLH